MKFAVYLLYLHAIGYGATAIFISIYIFSSVLGVSSNLWLADWSDYAKKVNTSQADVEDTNWRLGIYAVLGLGQGVLLQEVHLYFFFQFSPVRLRNLNFLKFSFSCLHEYVSCHIFERSP